MSISFEYQSNPSKLVNEPLSPFEFLSNSSQSNEIMNPEVPIDNAIYRMFFNSTLHPAIIVDLNVNTTNACEDIFNPAANSLKEFINCDIFTESRLENFKGTLSEFLNVARRKVAENINHTDILHLHIRKGTESSEAVFSFSATSFYIDINTKMLGILLMEISKTVKEELDALDIFKSSLIAALSHELNNPMNSLMLLLNTMSSPYCEEKKENLIEMALASASILQNKIRDLIDHATIEMDNIRLSQKKFYVDELFEELKQIFKHEIGMQNNKLITKIVSNKNYRLAIFGDRNRIEQVLVKLLSNANKYTSKGEITLSATEGKANFNVIFSVKDTGEGISKMKMKLLFDSLKQKIKQPDAPNRLYGLGLALASSICKCMDATLKVTSSEGSGTRFFFEIPVCQVTTFENPLDSVKRLHTSSYPLFPLIKMKEVSGKDDKKVNEVTNNEFKNDTKKIFEKHTLKSISMSRCLITKVSDIDNLEEDIQVHQIIPRYNGLIKKLVCNPNKSMTKLVSYNRKKPIVLIVDDVYSNRMAIRVVMNRMQVSTVEAINGEKAVSFVKSSFQSDSTVYIALILMDLNMPVMTGIEATVAIRKLEKEYGRRGSIPIVAITAHDAKCGKDRCIKAGMQDCEAKPVSKNTLKRIVEYYAPKLIKERGQNGIKV